MSQSQLSAIYPWLERHRTLAFTSKIFSISEVHCVEASTEPKPNSGNFVVLEAPDWVNMVVLTSDHQLVLIEQWRHGVSRTTLEVPGGMIDPGESPLEAAQRELREETGYAAPHWMPVGTVEPNPAIQSNRCHTFLATHAEPIGAPSFGEHERCRLVLEPYEVMDDLVLTGRISHALVVVAFYHVKQKILTEGIEIPPSED